MKTKQIKPLGVPARFTFPRTESKLSARGIKTFNRIDHKHAKPKIMNFRQETRYAFPANLGNAVNPLIFGKIPKPYIELERKQNAKVLRDNGLASTNLKAYRERVRAMNFRTA
jgi:hypothetical protein